MTSIYNLNPVSTNQTDTLLGALSNPDAGSVNGQLATIRSQTDALETDLLAVRNELTTANASPTANTWQARLQALVDAIGVAASPATNSLQARIQSILDAVGVSASPAANSLQARIQSLISNIGLPTDSVAASESSTASVIAFLKLIATRQNIRLSTGPTTQTLPVASSITAVNLGTAARRGFAVYNLGPVAILMRRNTDPTTSLYEIEIPSGSIFYDDIDFSGTVRVILKSGSTSQNVQFTVF